MRTALISDIHGNYPALMATFADIEREQCDRTLCLGDLVDGGAEGLEVVRCIRERGIATVQGNHDEYPNTPLPLAETEWLQQLPVSIVEGAVIYTHKSPRAESKRRKITTEIEAWNVFDDVPQFQRIFVGDIHVPLIFGERCAEKVSASQHDILYDEPIQLARDDRYIVCVGAVGYSRDVYDWARYTIYDDSADTITFKAPAETKLKF